jgi:hypothetical protein
MATTTTNFGWDIPQSTDLVKDGATAIAALGQDIDTAFIDLKGGTTGQVLAKASNTDLDYSWVAQDDSNAIQNAIVDAKGDLIAATAADTPARLAVGTDGKVLTADSTAATGIKWADAAGASGPAFRAYRNASQSISSATATKIQLNTENFDTDTCFDSTTNYRFTPTKAGYYQLTGAIYANTTGGATNIEGSIYFNGAASALSNNNPEMANNYTSVVVTNFAYFNGTTDYAELYVYSTGGSCTTEAGSQLTWFAGVWIRS